MIRPRSLLSNYYHIILILQELHQKLLLRYNSEDGLDLTKDKSMKKKVYLLLKQKKYIKLSDFSVEVLLQVLQKLFRELNKPLLSSSRILHRRWMDIGDYVYLVQTKQIDSDIRPDLILHIARFIHTHYHGCHLLVLQYFLGMLRHLCGKIQPKSGLRFNRKLLGQLCLMFAPHLFYRRPTGKQIFTFWKSKRPFYGHFALFFVVITADEIFATDEYAILTNLSPKLLTPRLPLFLVCEWNMIEKKLRT